MNESEIQISCVKWFAYKYGNSGKGMLMSIPNERATSLRTGGKLKQQGLAPGAPDIVILKKGCQQVLFIEMKTIAKHSKLSPSQIVMHQKLKSFGQVVFVCRGLDAFMLIVDTWFNRFS